MSQKFLLGETVKEKYLSVIDSIANLLATKNISPNILSFLGLVMAAISALFFCLEDLLLAGLFMALSGICDSLDGYIARISDSKSTFGALLDSSLDRYGELIVYVGIWSYFKQSHSFAATLSEVLVLLTILGSFMTSYVRARAEGLNIQCPVGLIQRPERICFLTAATILTGLINPLAAKISYNILNDIILKLAFLALTVGTNFTAVQRILFVNKFLKEQKEQSLYRRKRWKK